MEIKFIERKDGRTEEKQHMDMDKHIGFKMSKFAIFKCDIVRIMEKLGLE